MSTIPGTFPFGRGVELIASDKNGLCAFSKPAGVLSHPNEKSDQPRSLLDAPYNLEGEFYEWLGAPGVKHRLYLLNRLDSATSGVILTCSQEELAKEIRALFQRRHIHKVYRALVFGLPHSPVQAWRDKLAVEKRGGKIRTAETGNIPAEAQMKALRSVRGASPKTLIELTPKTGRSHQLRVQCAKRHLPIVGDATYGDFSANREFAKRTGEKRLFLHSYETEFSYEWKGRMHTFAAKAPMPALFEEALGA